MKRRFAVPIGNLGVLVVSLATLTTSARQATPYDPAMFEGIAIDHISSTPRLPELPVGEVTVGLQRITFEPGKTLELRYHGPVLYAVESGTLGVRSEGRKLVFIHTGPGGHVGSGPDTETLLTVDDAVYAEDGDLGPVRNAGDGPSIVLALLVVVQPDGVIEVEEARGAPVVATPAP